VDNPYIPPINGFQRASNNSQVWVPESTNSTRPDLSRLAYGKWSPWLAKSKPDRHLTTHAIKSEVGLKLRNCELKNDESPLLAEVFGG
jgi:hypothetical protein